MNRLCIIGRLTKDPEIRATQDGAHTVARFGIAVDIKKDQANFFNVTAWDKTAQFAEKYLRKGTKIGLEGQLRTDDWTNKDGQKITSVYILADKIEFCESKKDEAPKTDTNGFMTIPDTVDQEELPFNF